ncbi:hypothetical protein [Belliella pelovolcani]|uniref:Uncharacterized protein n=1 Tax=Belliella pelovolcani TaxID=529505 RepID=A0A1N7L442_9BACT|nr:hypothetical protein [Belliella pelovolcani]SIS68629.1 hypothetical protein SAMN05421761_10327 [Belliella pelovolcani]
MKKLMIAAVSASLLFACGQEKSVEERYLYEGDKIVDVETGDEYLLEESEEEFVVVHKDGTKEVIPMEETPFFGTTLSDDYVNDWKKSLEERKAQLLEDKKNSLKEARKARYAEYSDEELMEKFQKMHKDNADMTLQMDLIAELVDRGAISDEDAPDLLEVEPEFINFDIEIEMPESR